MSDTVDLFKSWHFYNENPNKYIFSEDHDSLSWTSEKEFQWSGDVEDIEKTLWNEGVVKLGSVSETYLGRQETVNAFWLSVHFIGFCSLPAFVNQLV